MPLYIYSCSQGHLTEARQKVSVKMIACECGEIAERQSIYATQIGGRARTPAAERKIEGFHRYVEASEQMAYEHDKAEESAQRKLPTPPIYEIAKKRADKLMAAGITDSRDYDPRYVK